MSAAWLEIHTVLSMRVDAREAYRLMHAYRDEELLKFADRLARRATLYGASQTVGEVIRDIQQLTSTDSATSPATTSTAAAPGAYPGELEMLRGLVRTLRVAVRPDEVDVAEVRRLLHHHASDDAAAREQARGKSTATSGDATSAAEFEAGRLSALAGQDPYHPTTGEDGRS